MRLRNKSSTNNPNKIMCADLVEWNMCYSSYVVQYLKLIDT